MSIMTGMPRKLLRRLSKSLRKTQVPASALPSSANTLRLGSVVQQRYRLDAELGQGGMGIVYRAHDLAGDRDVALKVLNVNAANPIVREQFLQEARIASQFDHPHIVRVYDVGAVDGTPGSPLCIIMELVSDLHTNDRRRFTFTRIVELGRQICDALDCIHSQGFVHRDLKPQNVLIERQGLHYVAKLADLGLARQWETANSPIEAVAGTVYYVAPEVVAGQPAGPAADLYALGAMLYEMVTGRVPFSDYDEASILSQHLSEPVVPPSRSRPDIPPLLEAIILRLLAKNPKERYASAREVSDELCGVTAKLKPAGARTHNLPPLPPGNGGLQSEIDRLKQLLESARLVTLVGPPEVGRDGLALAAAAQWTCEFPDGVWRVDLRQCSDPSLAPSAIASALDLQQEANRSLVVSLGNYLHEKSLLVLLDHCDAVTRACAQLTETILRVCPEVCILATSHEPLGVPGESMHFYRNVTESSP